jgi:two-component system, cell cycle sensor histidine kinase and response regulator CckA
VGFDRRYCYDTKSDRVLSGGSTRMGNGLADKSMKESTRCQVESHADLRPLLLVQKTELISEITQAIANDFNNVMMAITGYAELELRKTSAGDKRSLERMLSNAARATGLVQKLLTISRNSSSSPKSVNLNNLVSGMSQLLEQLTTEKAVLKLQLDDAIPAIHGDPAEIEQAILSLVITARNARACERDIVIRTAFRDIGEKTIAGDESDLCGKYVVLSIDRANLKGAADSHAPERSAPSSSNSRINTSVAAAHEIVTGVGGVLKCSSEQEQSISFKLYFPAREHTAVSEQSERNSPRSLPLARTVLIVDDDEAVRIPAAEFLKMEGFKVLQANTGVEAINVVLQSRSPVDVLVTDVVMPKMDGREVAQKLLELNPGLKVLYMSGDVDGARLNQLAGTSHVVTLRKPFRLDTLKDQIHELLGE